MAKIARVPFFDMRSVVDKVRSDAQAEPLSFPEAIMHKSSVIEYRQDDYACEGFAVWDDAGAKRPGILVFPEWVGVGEYTHKRAEMLVRRLSGT